MNYNLTNNLYSIRYFYPQETPEGLLEEIRKFIENNPNVSVHSINIDHNYSRDDNSALDHGWLANVTYIGDTEEED